MFDLYIKYREVFTIDGIIIYVLIAIIAVVVGLLFGYILRKTIGEKTIGSAEQTSKNLILDAEKRGDSIRKEKILEAKEDNSYLANVEGVVFPLKTRRKFGVEEKVLVLLRPEDVKVYRVSEDEDLEGPRLHGRINYSVYKGATVDLSVTLDNGKVIQAAEFFNEDDADINYNAGERVVISWVAGWEVVLDNEGE